MGGGVANHYVKRHRQRIGSARVVIEESEIRYHLGNANLDETYTGTLGASDIEDLHDAALVSDQAFGAAASTVFGSWWDDLCAAATAAGVAVVDHPVAVFRSHYAGAVSVGV